MLLPPLRERMELLHSLLPQGPDRWESLSKGQVRSPCSSEGKAGPLWGDAAAAAAAADLTLTVLIMLLNCKFLE